MSKPSSETATDQVRGNILISLFGSRSDGLDAPWGGGRKCRRPSQSAIAGREASMPLEGNERAHRQVELAQFVGAAELGQIDDEAGGEHLRAHLAQQLDR